MALQASIRSTVESRTGSVEQASRNGDDGGSGVSAAARSSNANRVVSLPSSTRHSNMLTISTRKSSTTVAIWPMIVNRAALKALGSEPAGPMARFMVGSLCVKLCGTMRRKCGAELDRRVRVFVRACVRCTHAVGEYARTIFEVMVFRCKIQWIQR